MRLSAATAVAQLAFASRSSDQSWGDETMASAGGARSEPWFYLRLDLMDRPDAFSGSAGGPMVRRGPQPAGWVND
jgi:hypothetical protein